VWKLTLAGFVAGLIDRRPQPHRAGCRGFQVPPGCEGRHPLEPAGGISPAATTSRARGRFQRRPAACWPASGNALNRQGDFDAILNLGYDWLALLADAPSGHAAVSTCCEHGSVATVMDEVNHGAGTAGNPGRLAFHSAAQPVNFRPGGQRRLVGTALTWRATFLRPGRSRSRAGWAGRIAGEGSVEMRPPLAGPAVGRRVVWGFAGRDPGLCPGGWRLPSPPATIRLAGIPSQRTGFRPKLGGCAVAAETRPSERGLRQRGASRRCLRGRCVALPRGGPPSWCSSGLTRDGWFP